MHGFGPYARWVFPTFYDRVMKSEDHELRRARLAEGAAGRVLEIGIGTGLNLAYYPEAVRRAGMWAVEPNPGMRRRAEARAAELGVPLDVASAAAEALPFEDARFDTVVTSHALCSVRDVEESLAEIRRVLRPGGRLLFLEHGRAEDPAVARWQRRIGPVWRLVGAGCRLDVPVPSTLEQAGFRIARLRRGYLQGAPRTHGFLFEGIAQPT